MSEVNPTDWDASLYHRIADPQRDFGSAVLERAVLRGDETVVDAGCGSGGVTAELLGQLPRGRVIAVDVSLAMLEQARQTLALWQDQMRFVRADLVDLDVALGEQADVVFSTATFHWIEDHARLFGAVFRSLRPGGRLVAQCGGAGNLEPQIQVGDAIAAQAPYATYLADMGTWHHRATAEDTATRLGNAGFVGVRTWLEPWPRHFPDRSSYSTFLHSVVMRPQMALLPLALQRPYVEEVVSTIEAAGIGYVLDYVRLNMQATRPTAI